MCGAIYIRGHVLGEHTFSRDQCGFLMDCFIHSRPGVLDGNEVQECAIKKGYNEVGEAKAWLLYSFERLTLSRQHNPSS